MKKKKGRKQYQKLREDIINKEEVSEKNKRAKEAIKKEQSVRKKEKAMKKRKKSASI